VVRDGETGWVVPTVDALDDAIGRIGSIDRRACRRDFEARFTLAQMVAGHLSVYRKLVTERHMR
jgi:hypothetical protein